jgi:hypothetical protein
MLCSGKLKSTLTKSVNSTVYVEYYKQNRIYEYGSGSLIEIASSISMTRTIGCGEAQVSPQYTVIEDKQW